ncbi:hypothetical protein FYK55_07440 [Roseiconus nitratireducens]|uniref:Uncharacterized protein n=2 Tax=Roseiconus nitratireducens TaxID=2605748 RepID=A0A5M6DGQ3_9BACT|nr:hypothetical protein FYK55_07440 [Roseiconus nitratireducens]
MNPHCIFRAAWAVGLVCLLAAAGCSPPERFENERGRFVTTSDSDAAIPSGLRRTKYGWEDASLWTAPPNSRPQSIESWMERQQRLEPSWIRRCFLKLRTTPPLMIAVIQITAIAAIVHISRTHAMATATIDD